MTMRKFIKAIEPWYAWGQHEILRIDQHEPDFADESAGNVFRFEVGRTPPKVPVEEVDARRAAQGEAA
jgi:hypothetical protein